MRVLFLVAMLFSLPACGAFDSSKNAVSVAGPIDTKSSSGMTYLFKLAYDTAYNKQVIDYKGELSSEDLTAQRAYKKMAEAGFGLVRSQCSEFFTSRGENQKWLALGTDTVTTAGALATGILALAGSGTLAVSIVALTTATLYSSADVYTKNFLFGAENIDAVRTMTLNALAEDASETLATPLLSWNFAYALNAIMDNQELCKPSAIMAATRKAISSTRFKAANSTGAGNMDDLRKLLISSKAQGPVVPTEHEVAALCWAANFRGLRKASDDQAIKNATATFQKGPNTPGEWNNISRDVRTLCEQMSPAAQVAIETMIVEISTRGQAPASPAVTVSPAQRSNNVSPVPAVDAKK